MAENEMLDVDRLRKITDEMVTAITSPPFVEAMRTMKATAQDQRLKVGAKILNPEALRSKGAPLPVGMRITSRYFESGKPTIEVADPDEAGHPPIAKEIADISSLSPRQTKGVQSAGMCAGGGAGTVCGCAGS